MRKKLKRIRSIIVAIVILIFFIFSFIYRPVGLPLTKAIAVSYKDEKNFTITDKNDVKRLSEICRGTALNDSSSCGFTGVKMVFVGLTGCTTIYPACDGCTTMHPGFFSTLYYDITKEERKELVEILKKYDVHFPCN